LSWYGSDEDAITELAKEHPELGAQLSESLNIIRAQVVWAVREEMARTVEDFLARRTRALFLDARESIRMAPEVARIMARERGKDQAWEKDQVESYTMLARSYLLN
jgi:glycerol-3-phosphate dehydrogenase